MVLAAALLVGKELSLALSGHDLKVVRLRQPPAERDDKDGWPGPEPEQGAPTVGSGRDELTKSAVV
jgi:hypothetical protein